MTFKSEIAFGNNGFAGDFFYSNLPADALACAAAGWGAKPLSKITGRRRGAEKKSKIFICENCS